MSTHWGYACISHDPAITMDEPGGVGGRPNHAFEAMKDALPKVRAGQWPMVDDGLGWQGPVPLVGATGCESSAPVRFLLRHPHCRIAIYNEYGDTWVQNASGWVQVSGNDGDERPQPCTCVSPVPIVTDLALLSRGRDPRGWRARRAVAPSEGGSRMPDYVHRECGMPWTDHNGHICPDNVRTDLSDEARERRAERARYGRQFEAQFPGVCAHGDRIRVNDLVRYVDDVLEHVECPEAVERAEPLELVRPVCPVHFTELPVSGVCGDCE